MLQIIKKRDNKKQSNISKMKNAWNDTKDAKSSKFLPYTIDPK